MGRLLTLLVATICYFAFFVSFVYLVGFVAGFPELPRHVDKGIEASTAIALVIDLALIALFGIQHSVMARPGFKAAWTKIVPASLERSVYCLATAIVLFVLFAFWHPIAQPVWTVTNETGRIALWALFGLGFLIVFISTWLISHFELFGLEQAWSHFRGRDARKHQFRTPLFYRMVRHPIYLGFFIALWATPDMTVGHLVLAIGLSIYLFIGASHEERDLVTSFGDSYVEYQSSVGMILPGIGRKQA
jgi:protein-S-isoprenylcysteine O-methyltransferase Ste14